MTSKKVCSHGALIRKVFKRSLTATQLLQLSYHNPHLQFWASLVYISLQSRTLAQGYYG